MNIIDRSTWPETSFQSLFIKNASKGSYNEQFIGCVLQGCYFSPKFSLERITAFSEADKERWPDAENIYEFNCGGYITFNLADVVFLDGSQVNDYKGKMQFGKNLDLKERENSWLTWDPFIRKLYIDDPRKAQREAIAHAV